MLVCAGYCAAALPWLSSGAFSGGIHPRTAAALTESIPAASLSWSDVATASALQHWNSNEWLAAAESISGPATPVTASGAGQLLQAAAPRWRAAIDAAKVITTGVRPLEPDETRDVTAIGSVDADAGSHHVRDAVVHAVATNTTLHVSALRPLLSSAAEPGTVSLTAIDASDVVVDADRHCDGAGDVLLDWLEDSCDKRSNKARTVKFRESEVGCRWLWLACRWVWESCLAARCRCQ